MVTKKMFVSYRKIEGVFISERMRGGTGKKNLVDQTHGNKKKRKTKRYLEQTHARKKGKKEAKHGRRPELLLKIRNGKSSKDNNKIKSNKSLKKNYFAGFKNGIFNLTSHEKMRSTTFYEGLKKLEFQKSYKRKPISLTE